MICPTAFGRGEKNCTKNTLCIGEWWWSDLTGGGMWEILDGEDFDHPHPWLIPVTLSHLKMSPLSFHGHSNIE